MTTTAELHSAIDVLAECRNITYRMLDHWLRAGGISITRDGTGCGSRRGLSDLDRDRLLAIDAWLGEMPFGALAGSDTTHTAVFIPLIWRRLDCERWPTQLYIWHGGDWEISSWRPTSTSWIFIDLSAHERSRA